MKSALTLLLLCLTAVPGFAGEKPTPAAIDPDQAYKNNCLRCHAAVRTYSPRMTSAILMHMRVRANMTAEDTQAILQYLTDLPPAAVTAPAARKQK